MDGDAYGDMIAAYRAYWSSLRRLELVILMDARVLGRIWTGQIMGRDPQIEAWAADTAPDVGILQKLLSTLDDQRAVWSQVRAFRWDGSRGQRGEESIRRDPPKGTEAGGGSRPGARCGPGPDVGRRPDYGNLQPTRGTAATRGGDAEQPRLEGSSWYRGRKLDQWARDAAESRQGRTGAE